MPGPSREPARNRHACMAVRRPKPAHKTPTPLPLQHLLNPNHQMLQYLAKAPFSSLLTCASCCMSWALSSLRVVLAGTTPSAESAGASTSYTTGPAPLPLLGLVFAPAAAFPSASVLPPCLWPAAAARDAGAAAWWGLLLLARPPLPPPLKKPCFMPLASDPADACDGGCSLCSLLPMVLGLMVCSRRAQPALMMLWAH